MYFHFVKSHDVHSKNFEMIWSKKSLVPGQNDFKLGRLPKELSRSI